MKVVTNDYKTNVKTFGRELDSKITYTINGVETELGSEELNSVTPHYKADILKSVMKQLDIDSNVDIPLNTVINYQFGVKVGNSYEYINYGNYVVIKSEKNEDTNSYQLTCYDKMIYAMKDYEDMNLVYPMTVRDYISEICNYLGLTFKNYNSTFANYNKTINTELYLDSQGNSLGYTFRDVLDQLAEVTGSVICINELDDELEIRYPNSTGVTLNEEYLKDVNVKFGKVYGPVNTVVLSRSADSDKIYDSYPSDLPDEDKIAIEIKDNQIMNFNDRDTYLSDILNRLLGLTYNIADYSSPGITFLELYDMYNVSIGETTYPCLMLEDEAQITQGLSENVVAEEPQTSETDYTKADKTDRRINQTYLIVDKQNQTIESVVSTVGEQNSKISQITQTVDEINSKISDIADITTSNETTMASMTMDDINASEPIQLKVYPIGQNISYLYPRSNLYPSSTLYPTIRTIRFHNETTSEDFDYILPDDLLYYDSNNYDEFLLDYGDGTAQTQICQVTKKCKYNADGTVGLLSTPVTNTYTYPSIVLTNGDYTVSILSYSQGYIFARLMAQNIYTTQFYTKAETNSAINQKANEITLGVNQTLSNYSTTSEMNSAINVKANEITSSVSETYATKTTTNSLSSRISQTAKNISLSVNNGSTTSGIVIGITKEDGTTEQATGTIEMNGLVKFTDLSTSGSTTINGSNITTGSISANRISGGTINANNINVTNLTASNINRGSLSSVPLSNCAYNFAKGSEELILSSAYTYGIFTGWYSSNIRLTVSAKSTGGEFRSYGSGSSGAYLNQTGVHTFSDIRYKKHIENISKEESFNIINNLNPICYDYDDNERHRGLSAQEVERVLNNNGIERQIYEIDKDGRYSLNYTELIPDLINCIKYQQEEIKELKKEMEELKNGIN